MKKKDSWLLVKYSDNWADEMDVEGCRVYRKSEWDIFCKAAKMEFKENGSYVYYVGTNEDIEYRSYEDFMSQFEVKSITKDQLDVIEKLGLDCMGFFPESIGESFIEEDMDGE